MVFARPGKTVLVRDDRIVKLEVLNGPPDPDRYKVYVDLGDKNNQVIQATEEEACIVAKIIGIAPHVSTQGSEPSYSAHDWIHSC